MSGERQTEPHQAEIERERERWTIYKRIGVWDDVIEGPDTGEDHDGGIDVVPAVWKVRAENQVAEIVAWLQHIDRLDEIPGAKVGLPKYNPLWDAANAIAYRFAGLTQPARERTDVVAEIVVLIRSYANVHMTKALADLIEHKYGGRKDERRL